MAGAAVDSAVDVVIWFMDRALDDKEYLQPQKLHRLLYLAQGYFAVANNGKMLMPAMFIADETGPIEPTTYRIFENGRPFNIEGKRISEPVENFLDSVWRKFGPHSTAHLNAKIQRHLPYQEALRQGLRTEITLESMRKFYGSKLAPEEGAPGIKDVLRPRVMRAQDGRPVNVHKWMPPVKPPEK